MLATTFLLLLVQGLLQYPQPAGHGLDEATRERMEQRAEYLSREMAQLMQELEHQSPEQSAGAWGALQLWQFWETLAVLVLLLALWFGAKKVVSNEEKWEEVSAPGNGKDKHDGAEDDEAHQR